MRAILHCLKTENSKRQFAIWSQLLASASAACIAYGVAKKNMMFAMGGLASFSIFTFPSLTILLHTIGNRVGKNFDLVATGNVFTGGSAVTCLLLAIDDYTVSMLSDIRASTVYMLEGLACLTLLNAGLIIYGTCITYRKFVAKLAKK